MKQKKNLLFLVGILSVLLVFGFVLVGCSDDPPADPSALTNTTASPTAGSLVGVWVNAAGNTLHFTSSTATAYSSSGDIEEFSYTYNSSSRVFTLSSGGRSADGTATVTGTTLVIATTGPHSPSPLDGNWTWKP